MTIPDPTYITADEVQANTRITGLAALADEDIDTLITAAEDLIDAFCGSQPHHPYDDNVDRVFPRECDYARTSLTEHPLTPEIPYAVSRACLLQVEYLYLQWWTASATTQAPVAHDVTQQSIGGDGSISQTYARGGVDFSAATLSPQVKALLGAYRSRSAGIGLSDPRGSPALLRAEIGTLSSRE